MTKPHRPNILDIDDEEPKHDDLVDIQDTPCINCGKKYNYGTPIYFTRIKPDLLIWWHCLSFSCTHLYLANEKDT